MFQAIVVKAGVPEDLCHMSAEERMLHEFVEFLQSFRMVGNYSSPDEIWRADSMQVLTYKTTLSNSATPLRREKTEHTFVELCWQLAGRRLERR